MRPQALNDVYYFAGSFSSVGGTNANHIASYSSSQNTISALGQNGPDGVIRALYCDSSRKQVWAGGQFSFPGASVAVWDTVSSGSATSFGKLTGAAAQVLSTTSNSSQSSLYERRLSPYSMLAAVVMRVGGPQAPSHA